MPELDSTAGTEKGDYHKNDHVGKPKEEGAPARLSTRTETSFLDIVVKILCVFSLLTSLTACLLFFFFLVMFLIQNLFCLLMSYLWKEV